MPATEAGALAEPQKLPLLQPEEKRKRWGEEEKGFEKGDVLAGKERGDRR